jgi:hypothetical protein
MDEDVLHLLVGGDHHDDDLRIFTDIRDAAHGFSHRPLSRAPAPRAAHRRPATSKPLFHHVARHLIAHRAEPDDAGVFSRSYSNPP